MKALQGHSQGITTERSEGAIPWISLFIKELLGNK